MGGRLLDVRSRKTHSCSILQRDNQTALAGIATRCPLCFAEGRLHVVTPIRSPAQWEVAENAFMRQNSQIDTFTAQNDTKKMGSGQEIFPESQARVVEHVSTQETEEKPETSSEHQAGAERELMVLRNGQAEGALPYPEHHSCRRPTHMVDVAATLAMATQALVQQSPAHRQADELDGGIFGHFPTMIKGLP